MGLQNPTLRAPVRYLLELLLGLSSICHAPLQPRTGGKETAHGNLQNGKTLKAEPGSNLFAPHLLL